MTPGALRVSVAPGRTAPDASVTVPLMVPTPPWASTGSDRPRQNNAANNMLPTTNLCLMLCASLTYTCREWVPCEIAGSSAFITFHNGARGSDEIDRHAQSISEFGSYRRDARFHSKIDTHQFGRASLASS